MQDMQDMMRRLNQSGKRLSKGHRKIAEYIVELLKKSGLELTENPDFNGTREDTHAFKKMSDEEKDEYIKLGEDEKTQLYDLLKPFGFLFPCV